MTAVAGIGVDIVGVARMESILERHGRRFIDRICRPGEVLDREGRRLAQHVGGLFAAKEAVLKALGTGWDQGLGFRQIEVVRDSSGRPRVRLHEAAAEAAQQLGVAAIHLSITHDAGVAAAIAVLEKERGSE